MKESVYVCNECEECIYIYVCTKTKWRSLIHQDISGLIELILPLWCCRIKWKQGEVARGGRLKCECVSTLKAITCLWF